MLFFSSECVCAVYGTFTSECVFAVLTLFMVPSRANMSSLFRLFFSSECAYAVYGTFSFFFLSASECVYAVMWNSYQRICFGLLYATFASEYGYAGL